MIDWRPISEPAPADTPLLVFMPSMLDSRMTVARKSAREVPQARRAAWELECPGGYAEQDDLPAPPSHWALIEGPKP